MKKNYVFTLLSALVFSVASTLSAQPSQPDEPVQAQWQNPQDQTDALAIPLDSSEEEEELQLDEEEHFGEKKPQAPLKETTPKEKPPVKK